MLTASGEDDLLAYYLQHIDENGEHTFSTEKDEDISKITIMEGVLEGFCKHRSRIRQIKANEISYSWDELIEKFIYHVTTGTSYLLTHPDIKSQEEIFRFLAKENRTRRRILAESIYELIEKTPIDCRTTRTLLPLKPGEPYYVFFLMPKSAKISYERYRELRGQFLEDSLKNYKVEIS